MHEIIIIDTYSDLQKLKNEISIYDYFLYTPLIYNNIHYLSNSNDISFIFIICNEKYYILNKSHPDVIKLDLDDNFFDVSTTCWCYDYKCSSYHLNLYNAYECNLNNSYYDFKLLNINMNSINFFAKSNTNIIPISIFIEYVCGIDIDYSKNKLSKEFIQYHNELMFVFSSIEKNGIYTQFFGIDYALFNFYTKTSRPTYTFNGINYTAISKKDETSSKYVSRYGTDGILIEVDFKSYHLILCAKLLNFQINSDIYIDIANKYNIDRNEAKQETFKSLYGEYSKIQHELLDRANVYKHKLFEVYKKHNNIKSKIYGKTFSNLELDKNKVFAYYMQNLETEANIKLMIQILHILENTNIKLFLYTYDSFTFDFPKKELKYIKHITEVFGYNNIPYKITYGTNLINMKEYTQTI